MSVNPCWSEAVTKAIEECMAHENHFVARYLHATGARIEDTELVRHTDIETGTIKFWCQPRVKQ